jgi:hypothetical protein
MKLVCDICRKQNKQPFQVDERIAGDDGMIVKDRKTRKLLCCDILVERFVNILQLNVQK